MVVDQSLEVSFLIKKQTEREREREREREQSYKAKKN